MIPSPSFEQDWVLKTSPWVKKSHFIAIKIMSSRRRGRQNKKQRKINTDSKNLSHDEDNTGGIFIFGEKISCYPGWSLEASLKDIAVEEVAASKIPQDDDGEIFWANVAGRGCFAQLDNIQAEQKKSAAQINTIMAKNHVLQEKLAKLQEVVNELSSRNSEYMEARIRFFPFLNGIS